MVTSCASSRSLLNLLGNAIKFTEQGGITINVSMVERLDYRGTFSVRVIDTGIGMSAEVQEKIFSPFEQADNSTTRRFGGTGLGLTICRKLADLMGGAITVESRPGAGSTFYLELPFGLSPAAGEVTLHNRDWLTLLHGMARSLLSWWQKIMS